MDEDMEQLWYHPEENLFTDCNGFIFYDIFSVITPNDLLLFKDKKQYMVVSGINGWLVELFYGEDEVL